MQNASKYIDALFRRKKRARRVQPNDMEKSNDSFCSNMDDCCGNMMDEMTDKFCDLMMEKIAKRFCGGMMGKMSDDCCGDKHKASDCRCQPPEAAKSDGTCNCCC